MDYTCIATLTLCTTHLSPSWILPLQRPLANANAVLSLPSDKKFVHFSHASFGSPSISTFLRALRKGYLSTLPQLTSALICNHIPNTEANAMGHLDRKRQGLDSTTAPVAPSPPHIPTSTKMRTILMPYQTHPTQILPSTKSSSTLPTST